MPRRDTRTRWQVLYTDCAQDLLRFLFKLIGDREIAGELMQEAFVHAIRSGVDVSSLRSARSWLFRIATNLAHDHHRRKRVVTLALADVGSADDGFTDATGQLIRQVLAALPYHEAATLLLHYESGFSRQEISEMEGIT